MTKEQQKYIFIGFVIVVFIFIYFNFFLGPVNRRIREKKNRIEELTRTLSEVKREAEQLEELKTKIAVLEYEYKELQELLPKEKDIPDLIRQITTGSQRFGIKIQNITIKPVDTTVSPEYDEIPFALTILGTFHRVFEFLTQLGQGKRLMSAKDLQLSAQISPDRLTTISGNFTLIAYKLKS